VAVVNWNTAHSALRAAKAYRESTGVRARVAIVDNASAPEQQALLRAGTAAEPELRLLFEPRNLGYGAAANDALAGTDAELVCVANADLVPAPDMLARLAEVALGDRGIGLLAPRLEGAERRYHARLPRGFTLPARAFAGSFGHRTVADPPPGEVLGVPQPAGACLLVRAELWGALGGFDPRFFLWFEDVDLARRSRALGYRNVVVGSAVATHAGGEAFALLAPAERQRIRMRSLSLYATKHHPRYRRATNLAIALALPIRTRGTTAKLPSPQPNEFADDARPRLDDPERT
jgi:N-acetylglucosaminyl-diphospho-decaprenol L-rhamnosyltransferase